MRIPLPLLLIAAIAFASLVGAAEAFNIQFLRTSPAASFSEQDWELASKTLDDALDNASDGESRSWENPAAGNGGTYTVQAAPTNGEGRCRRLRIEHHSRNANATSEHVFCRQPDGRWAVTR